MARGARGLRVLIAGGGTGGHLYPGLAIAEALAARAPDVTVRFAGSSYGLESRVVPARGYRLHRIAVRGLYGVSWARRLRVAALLPVAFVQCVALLAGYRPHLIIGVGGYASGPVLATGLLLGFRCVIQEQNAYPGLTNRLLGRFVRASFLAVPDAHGLFRNARVTGTPVRQAVLALRREPERDAASRDDAGRGPLLFIFGGSQGARAINRAVTEALPRLAARAGRLRIVHQTGRADHGWVRETYAGTGLEAHVVPFIEDMADVFRRCRLVVSRAGASAVNEIVAARRAAVLIPIPGTSGEHQLRNAQWVARAGAGVLIEQADLSGEALAGTLEALLDDPARLDAMENATDALFPGDAAATIAEACLALAR